MGSQSLNGGSGNAEHRFFESSDRLNANISRPSRTIEPDKADVGSLAKSGAYPASAEWEEYLPRQ